MAVLNFVVSKYMTGFEDSVEVDISQMADGSDYEISDPYGFIAGCIFESIEGYIDFKYNYTSLYKLLHRDGIYKLNLIQDEESSVSSIVLQINNKDMTYSYDIIGDIRIRQIFSVFQIEESNVVYLVNEHIIKPSENCALIERCYHPFFEDLSTAIRYMNHKMKSYNAAHGSVNSGYRVFVADRSLIENSEWYKLNMRISEDISKYHLDPEEYRYVEDIYEASEMVAADIYDELDVDARNEIDMHVYNKISDFLDPATREHIEFQFEVVSSEDIRSVVDNAVISALILAQDEDTFMAVHKALGVYDYRVGAFTDDVYMAHPDKGYILLSADGELGWYEDCYFLNEWEGARHTPYYHKFMPNENDTLLCLREYHPELIVDELPDPTLITKYKSMYKSSIAEQRKQHDEMIFTMNKDTEYVIGNWYNKGLYNESCKKNVVFPRKYMKYLLSAEHCRDLLSGLEIVIDDYVSISGIECSIRGYLSDTTGPFDEHPRYGFVRSDIGGEKRFKINAEFGIQEPGLYSDGGV